MEPMLVSISDACHLLGLSKSKLYQLISSGEITVRKVGRKTLISRSDLTAFVERLPVGRSAEVA